MPIGNITQTISELPAAGSRGVDVQSIFVIKQEDFQDHLQGTTVTELNTFKDQLNSRISEINSTATTMNGYVNDAFMGSSTATTKASEASTSATAALNSKNQASTFATNSSNSATKSSQWADNNYNVAVETGKYSAKHWSTVAQNATVNKVDKVTSTDNAIVRFDGTTGAVQNSNVIITDGGDLLLTSGTGGLGYGTGSGGTVIQLTSKSTSVTLNKPSGRITMHNEALAAGASVSFDINNSLFSVDIDHVIITPLYQFINPIMYRIECIGNGGVAAIRIRVTNIHNVSLSESLMFRFCIIKGAIS